MNHRRQIVTGKRGADSSQLPDWLSEYVVIVQQMLADGRLDEISTRLHVYRQGGYTSVDAALFLLAFFSSGKNEGLKGFDEDVVPYRAQLAAVGGRRRFPTQPSMSRFLSAVDHRSLDEFGSWLLLRASGIDEVLGHPTMAVHDAHGSPWQVFDLDGTLTTFRARSLPRGPDLPEARRDVDDELARPGYHGRKRGEVQLCRSTLAHLGSSAWLGVWLSPGNEDARGVPARAASAVADAAHEAGVEPGQCVIRFDGLYGGWVVAEACRRAGVQYLLRWKSYDLLSDPAIIRRLKSADWYVVDSSLSGPTRYSTELGSYTRSNNDPDDAPLSTRLVVSRYVDTGSEGAGVVIDGYRYELYATSLEPGAFPAAETVALYYGRIAEENRFAQEDRELRLDHLFSSTLGGQQLALLIGLFLWNARTRRGLDLVKRELDKRPLPKPVVRKTTRQPDEEPVNPHMELVDTLAQLDWDLLLEWDEHWAWSSSGLRCPAGRTTPLKMVRIRGGCHGLVFRARREMCTNCSMRAYCTNSVKPSYRKELHIAVDREVGEEISLLHRQSLPSILFDHTECAPVDSVGLEPPSDVDPGPMEIAGPHLVPSALRRGFRKRCSRLMALVLAIVPPPDVKSPFFAANSGERQRRRLTWAEREKWNQLPPEARVEVSLLGVTKKEATQLLNVGRKRNHQRKQAA